MGDGGRCHQTSQRKQNSRQKNAPSRTVFHLCMGIPMLA
jgi:hypothetical protein